MRWCLAVCVARHCGWQRCLQELRPTTWLARLSMPVTTIPAVPASPGPASPGRQRPRRSSRGDTVLIHTGTYREHVDVKVSGAPDRPITFAAAPGERVVVKGSERIKGRWTALHEEKGRKEPYPNAFANVWCIPLGEEFFTDPRFEASYRDKSKRWVSQVFVSENLALQMIGPDRIYHNESYLRLPVVGRGLGDIFPSSFYFDPTDQMLYVSLSGSPSWYSIEVGVRGFVLTVQEAHDLVIRGLEIRQNRQPGGQWPMASVGNCERVLIEDCRFYQADFCGLGIGRSKDCTVRRCDLSYNGKHRPGYGPVPVLCHRGLHVDVQQLPALPLRLARRRHEVHSRQPGLHRPWLRSSL